MSGGRPGLGRGLGPVTETGESLEGVPRVTWLCGQGLHSPAHHRRLGPVYHMTQSHLHAQLDSRESGFLGLRLGWGVVQSPGGQEGCPLSLSSPSRSRMPASDSPPAPPLGRVHSADPAFTHPREGGRQQACVGRARMVVPPLAVSPPGVEKRLEGNVPRWVAGFLVQLFCIFQMF